MFSVTQQLDRAAEIFGDKVAVRYAGRSRTWNDVKERTERFSAALRKLGVSSGERVAMLANNNDVYFEFFFAVPRAGGIAVPINTRLSPDEIVYWLNDSGSSILLVDETFWDVVQSVRARLDTVHHVLFIGEGEAPAGAETLEAFKASAPAIPDSGRADDDVAVLFYTGGTTGHSKGVMQTHAGLIINIMQWAIGIGVTNNERMLIVAPMFHMVAGLNCMVAAIMGASVTILPRFDVPMLLAAVESDRITNTAMVPIMINRLAQDPTLGDYDISSLGTITYGGAPMPDTCLSAAMKTMPHVKFFQVYGQTEGGPTISILGAEYHVMEGPLAGKRGSAGRPVPCAEVRIFDEDGHHLPQGEKGEICVRSPSLSPGYWNNPAETAAAKRDGWLRTGDAGYFDADGFLYVVDRIKDMIVSGGENVYSAEVENVLAEHPAVLECAVIAIPHPEWGEAVHGIVRLRPGMTADAAEIISFCRERLAGFKCVRSIDFRTEPFPVSGANKVLKKELRKPYWAGLGKAVN